MEDRFWFRLAPAKLGAVFLLIAQLNAAEPSAPPSIVLLPGAVPAASFELRGLPVEIVQSLRALPKDDAQWKRVFAVRVDAEKSNERPAMLGSYEVAGEAIHFKPRFPLERGLNYLAIFDSAQLLNPPKKRIRIEQRVSIAKSTAGTAARLTAVFPSGNELPENLLRFYLHFSAPMQQGDSYRHVQLVDETGKIVERPFLEVPQELWNADGTRLTLLLDPGRVKQGLKPREESGPVLVAGRNYTLQVDTTWLDAEGRPLAESGRKVFRTVPADATQPDPKLWKIVPPNAGARGALTIQFPEPLDEAMLHRALAVVTVVPSASGRNRHELAGTISVAADEKGWSFTPSENWRGGRYAVVISTGLEDRAGNSIGRAFEVDLRRTSGGSDIPSTLTVEFDVPVP